jgi:hypothetical protein
MHHQPSRRQGTAIAARPPATHDGPPANAQAHSRAERTDVSRRGGQVQTHRLPYRSGPTDSAAALQQRPTHRRSSTARWGESHVAVAHPSVTLRLVTTTRIPPPRSHADRIPVPGHDHARPHARAWPHRRRRAFHTADILPHSSTRLRLRIRDCTAVLAGTCHVPIQSIAASAARRQRAQDARTCGPTARAIAAPGPIRHPPHRLVEPGWHRSSDERGAAPSMTRPLR